MYHDIPGLLLFAQHAHSHIHAATHMSARSRMCLVHGMRTIAKICNFASGCGGGTKYTFIALESELSVRVAQAIGGE